MPRKTDMTAEDTSVTEPLTSLDAAENQPTEPIPAQSANPDATTPAERTSWRDAARTHVALAVVLLITAAGMVRIVQYHWVQGAVLIGGALVVGALFRAVLPPHRAGLLAVRSRPVDVLTYLILGSCVIFVALTIVGRPFG